MTAKNHNGTAREITPRLSWSELFPWKSRFASNEDFQEADDDYRVEPNLPGVRKQDVAVDVIGRHLVIHDSRVERERADALVALASCSDRAWDEQARQSAK